MFKNLKTANDLLQEKIAIAAEEKKAELRKQYETLIQGDILYMNTVFKADAYSQDLITKCLSAGSVPEGFYWKDEAKPVNNKVAMTYADLQGLSMTILWRNQMLFAHLSDKKDEILAASQDPVDPVAAIGKITW